MSRAQVACSKEPSMQSSRKGATSAKCSGPAVPRARPLPRLAVCSARPLPRLAICSARPLLRLTLGLLGAMLGLLALILAPAAATRAERVPSYADLASPAVSFGGAGWSTKVSRPVLAAPGGVSAASTGTVVVNLNPSSSSVAKDQIFTVDIQIVAGAQQVDGAEIHLYFSKTYLQVVDSDSETPGVQIEDLSGWNAPLANAVYTDTEPARILFAAGILGAGTKPSGTFSLARIHFKALQSTEGGSTPLVFGTVLPYQTQIYYGVTLVLGGVENGSVTISGGTPTVTPTPPTRTVFLPVVLRRASP
jgi:hypothetical protein